MMATNRGPGDSASLITCLGEALIDFLPITEDGRMTGFGMHAGGSPFNVAVATARLGRPVELAGKLSTDAFGRHLRSRLEDEGVGVAWLARTDAPTTLAFVTTEDGEPSYAFYGEGAADTLVTVDDLAPALFDRTAVLHVGSISLLRGTTPQTVLDACRRLRGRALLSLDPNVRPALVGDEAAYRDLLRRLFAVVDLVRVSALDLAWLAPGQASDDAAAELVEQGPELVVVTDGADEVLAVRRGTAAALRVSGFAVDVVDTVGAGDAFDAALLARFAELGITTRSALATLSAEGLAAALEFAAATAALNCTRAGADPPDRQTVAAFLAAQTTSTTPVRDSAGPTAGEQ